MIAVMKMMILMKENLKKLKTKIATKKMMVKKER